MTKIIWRHKTTGELRETPSFPPNWEWNDWYEFAFRNKHGEIELYRVMRRRVSSETMRILGGDQRNPTATLGIDYDSHVLSTYRP